MLDRNGRRLWHNNTTKVEKKRYFEPISMTAALAGLTATAGTAGVGAGIWSLFGGKKKQSRDVPDPLAGIRQQLQALAGQVPGLVEKQKANIRDIYSGYKTEGEQGIGENVYAERGLGRTSIYDRLKTELYDKLAKSQAEAELNAELGGISTQANILSGTAGMYPTQTELPEEPSKIAPILGAGTSLLAQNWMNEQSWKRQESWLDKILSKQPSMVTA